MTADAIAARASFLPARHYGLAAALSLFALITLPAIVTNVQTEAGLSYDAIHFHLPQINYFLQDPAAWIDYPATAPTLPGYHLLLAAMARAFGFEQVSNDVLAPRMIHWLLGVAGLLVVILHARSLRRDASNGPVRSAHWLPLLPLGASWYTLQSAVYFSSDLLAIGLVAAVSWLVSRPLLETTSVNSRALCWAGAVATLLVACRNLLAPVLLAPLIGVFHAPQSWRRILAVMLAISVGPALVIGTYVAAWGGLVPPGIASDLNHSGVFPYVWLHALAYAGLLALLYLPLDWRAAKQYFGSAWQRRGLQLALVALVTLWSVTPSNYDLAAGRFGSIVWSLAARLPMLGTHSWAVLALAIVGTGFIGYLVWRARQLELLPIELAMLLIYGVALALTSAAYQRYLEPMALMCLGLFYVRVVPAPSRIGVAWVIGVSTLSLASSAIRLYS